MLSVEQGYGLVKRTFLALGWPEPHKQVEEPTAVCLLVRNGCPDDRKQDSAAGPFRQIMLWGTSSVADALLVL